MKKGIVIAPSILGSNPNDCPKIVERLIASGADIIHYDVMDGKFVPNNSFSVQDFKMLKQNTSSDIFYDVHLMVEDVEKQIEEYLDAGANLVTFHYEAVQPYDIPRICKYVHDHNRLVGISVKPDTSITVLNQYLNLFDLVLIMSVEPGKGGQKFNESMLEKVVYLKEYREEHKLNYVIEIDGGINDETFVKAKNAGVEYFVAGSYILKSEDYKERIDTLR